MARVKKAINFTPRTEVEAHIAIDESLVAASPPKHDEDDAIGQAVQRELDREVRATIPALPPCALDGAARNSKVVVVRVDGKRSPVLMTPEGEHLLAVNDVAWTLPEGAKVSRADENRFVAVQLNHNRAVAPLVCTTAREAIEKFHHHFHG